MKLSWQSHVDSSEIVERLRAHGMEPRGEREQILNLVKLMSDVLKIVREINLGNVG